MYRGGTVSIVMEKCQQFLSVKIDAIKMAGRRQGQHQCEQVGEKGRLGGLNTDQSSLFVLHSA